MKRKLSSQNSNRGYSLLELIVAILIGSTILGAFSVCSLVYRDILLKELDKAKAFQIGKTAIQFLDNSIRSAGENLPGRFPSIELINGSNINNPNDIDPDTIIFRRSIIDERLMLCKDHNAGKRLYVSSLDNISGCDKASNINNLMAFKNLLGQNSSGQKLNKLTVFIYNFQEKVGELSTITSVSDQSSPELYVDLDNDPNITLTKEKTVIFAIEESKFALSIDPKNSFNNLLKIYINGQTTGEGVAFQISDVQFLIKMKDSRTFKHFYHTNESWKNIAQVKVDLSITFNAWGNMWSEGSKTLEIGGSYVPRNVLSNK